MGEFWSFGLSERDLAFLAFGALVAGVVRGFAGFGTAMIYLPVAAQVLSPFAALTTPVVKDLIAPSCQFEPGF